MVPRSVRRALAAAALVTALFFVLPTRAEAAPLSGPHDFWGWLDSFIEARISVWWGMAEKPHPAALQDKAGPCIDPNGCTDPQSVRRPAGCTAWNDAGACIDPNG